MKKLITVVSALMCILYLVSCANTPTTAEKWDLIPMVMVDGVLYLDTGHTNTNIRKCGTADGEITSTVDGTENPVKDNQSNFGTGYGYQYGTTEGTIEIYMNDVWRIFATEEVKDTIDKDTTTVQPTPTKCPDSALLVIWMNGKLYRVEPVSKSYANFHEEDYIGSVEIAVAYNKTPTQEMSSNYMPIGTKIYKSFHSDDVYYGVVR